jgi:hypothetical protein
MGAITKFRFVITYTDADNGNFSEMTHRDTQDKAITDAKVKIMLENFRFGLRLNAEIKNELRPNDPPIILKIDELLKHKEK